MRRFLFCVFDIWGLISGMLLPAEESRALRDEESSPEELGEQPSARRSAVEERHSPRRHRPRALRRAPVYEVPTIKGARG